MNRTPILFLNVLVIATCGLIYELLAGTLARMAGMFVLPIDLAPVEVQVNRLDNQALVHYYETELRRLQ